MSNSWHEALDAIEFHLLLTQAALAAGTPPPVAQSSFPNVALPPELADRARKLLALTQQLESAADGRLQQLQAALRSLPARRVAAPRPRTGTFVDIGA